MNLHFGKTALPAQPVQGYGSSFLCKDVRQDVAMSAVMTYVKLAGMQNFDHLRNQHFVYRQCCTTKLHAMCQHGTTKLRALCQLVPQQKPTSHGDD